MRPIKPIEFGAGLISIGLILWSLIYFRIPATFDRVIRMEALFSKYAVFILGTLILILSIKSILSPEHLFYSKKAKRGLFNILTLGISILICLIALEIFLEITSLQGCKQTDQFFHHSYIPNCQSTFKTSEWSTEVKINSAGFRDNELLPKENYDLRILMLGDSFTWGYGVEANQTFSELLQQKINGNGVHADVINAGATSYSPILEYLLLREKGVSLRPDVILLNFDLSDLQDDYLREQTALLDSEGNLIKVLNPEKNTFLLKIYKRLKVVELVNGMFIWLDRILPPPAQLDEQYFSEIKYDRDGISRYRQMVDEETHWNRTFHYLDLIAELSRKNNITFILSIYPYGHQVSKLEWAEGKHNLGFSNDLVYSSRVENILEEYAQRNHILFVSMFPHFKNSTDHPLYFPYDGHFNQNGHLVAAEAWYQYLSNPERGIIPPALPS